MKVLLIFSDPARKGLAMTTPPSNPPITDSRASGYVLVICSVLSVVIMTHHPVVHSDNLKDFVHEIQSKNTVNSLVHGSLIVLMGLLFFGFTELASCLGLSNPWVRLGLISYGIALIAMTIAALLGGFILPRYLARYQTSPQEDLEMIRHVLAFEGVVHRVAARVGALSMSMAVLLWSFVLLPRSGTMKAIAILGILAGAFPVIGLASGHLSMDVQGAGLLVLAQTIWSVAIGIQMIRRRI